MFFETGEQRFDRLFLDGKICIQEDVVQQWCPIGKHWITYDPPTTESLNDESWWLYSGNVMLEDHRRCCEELELRG